MSTRTREYRFASAEHWALGLCSGLDVGLDGTLSPIPEMGNRAARVTDAQETTLVAVAAEGVSYWRAVSTDEGSAVAVVRWLVHPNEPSAGFDTGGALAVSPRWTMDRSHIWAFTPETSNVTRTRRSSLDAAMVVDVTPAVSAARESDDLSLAVSDIASDGCHGIWVLACQSQSQKATDNTSPPIDVLIHLDADAQCVSVFDIPPGPGAAQQIGALSSDDAIVVLAGSGKYLLFLDVSTGAKKRLVPLSSLAPCWTCVRLATDGRNRIGLYGCINTASVPTSSTPQGQLYVLDGSGDVVDGPLTELFAEESPQTHGVAAWPPPTTTLCASHSSPAPTKDPCANGVSPPAMRTPCASEGPPTTQTPAPSAAIDFVRDLAIHRDAIWLATARGLWKLDSGTSADSSTSAIAAESQFLTPLLLSPESDRGRGWLRAEIDIDLPDGALIEVEFAGTDDVHVATTIQAIFADTTNSVDTRIASVWSTFDDTNTRSYSFSGPQPAHTPIAIPLFELDKRWLILGISLVVPPGVAPPPIRHLRVRYPDLSIEQHLPEIFRGEQNDPKGFLRRIAGVLETTTQDLDARIRNVGRSLDPTISTEGMLDYIASWMDLPWDEGLPEAAKRRLLSDSANIIAQRGTRSGLEDLLRALVGPGGHIEITDPTGEFSLILLGGGAARDGGRNRVCEGIRLPALLAGTRVDTPTLGAKAVLGIARLPCKGAEATALDPLASLAPSVTIDIATDSDTTRTLAKLIDGLLRAYLPAGLQSRVTWTLRPLATTGDDCALVLDDHGPGTLGTDSLIGRTVLAGESGRSRLIDCGLRVGFVLQ